MIVIGKTITIQVQPTDTVADLRSKIQEIETISPENQRLVFNGKTIGTGDGKTLADYGVRSDSTLHLYLSLPGGCPGAYHC